MPETEWTTERIKAGFDRFIEENGRLPMAPEIDSLEYLPSSRQIQRKFGGLRELRQLLGYEQVDFGKGASRSAFALKNSQRGIDAEFELEKQLVSRFGELYVHSEKRYGISGNRTDFVVFTPDGNFGVDVFVTNTDRDLQKNVNIKVDKYKDFPTNTPLYFVCANPDFDSSRVKNITRNMSKLSLLPNSVVVCAKDFFHEIEKYQRFENPKDFKSLAGIE